MKQKIICLFLLFAILCGAAWGCADDSAIAPSPALGTEPLIQQEVYAESVLKALTNEEYNGREQGSPGNEAAGDYIADQFAALGLQPYYPNYRHSYTYTQETVTCKNVAGYFVNGEASCDNIVGYLPGKTGEGALIIGAHFDGHYKDEGTHQAAYDNASGVATMLACAKLLCEAGACLDRDIIFVAFNGEEHHRNGAMALAPIFEERYSTIVFVNIDCVGLAGENPLLFYGRNDPNGLAADLAAAFGGGGQPEDGYPGDASAFSGHDMIVCTLSDCDMTIIPLPPFLHTAEDTLACVSPAKLQSVALALADYVLAQGDKRYAEEDYERTDFGEGPTHEELVALGEALAGEHSLSYDQAYCHRLSEEDMRLFLGIGDVNTPEKLNLLYPDMRPPQAIGDYALETLMINTEVYYGGVISIYESGGQQRLPSYGFSEVYPSGTFVEGEIYSFPLPAPGATLTSLNLIYANEEQRMIIQIRSREALSQENAEYLNESGVEAFGPGFEGFVTHREDSPGDGVYSRAGYQGETGHVTLILAGGIFPGAEEFASLLTLADLPALLNETIRVSGAAEIDN